MPSSVLTAALSALTIASASTNDCGIRSPDTGKLSIAFCVCSPQRMSRRHATAVSAVGESERGYVVNALDLSEPADVGARIRPRRRIGHHVYDPIGDGKILQRRVAS